MTSANSNTQLFISFIFLLIIASLTAYYADKKGRNSTAWFILGLLFSVFATLILFFLPSLKPENTEASIGFPSVTPPKSSIPIPPKQLTSPEANKLWYYLDQNHQQYGPVSLIALKDLWDTGQLELNSYIWSEGMPQWEKIDNLPEIKIALSRHQG